MSSYGKLYLSLPTVCFYTLCFMLELFARASLCQKTENPSNTLRAHEYTFSCFLFIYVAKSCCG